MTAITMHPGALARGEAAQVEAVGCSYCQTLFVPRKRWGAFCSQKCRTAYDVEVGCQGTVASVRKINRGASVVIHLTGPAAERALKLGLREVVRVVRKP
jgi:hypothetical protein